MVKSPCRLTNGTRGLACNRRGNNRKCDRGQHLQCRTRYRMAGNGNVATQAVGDAPELPLKSRVASQINPAISPLISEIGERKSSIGVLLPRFRKKAKLFELPAEGLSCLKSQEFSIFRPSSNRHPFLQSMFVPDAVTHYNGRSFHSSKTASRSSTILS